MEADIDAARCDDGKLCAWRSWRPWASGFTGIARAARFTDGMGSRWAGRAGRSRRCFWARRQAELSRFPGFSRWPSLTRRAGRARWSDRPGDGGRVSRFTGRPWRAFRPFRPRRAGRSGITRCARRSRLTTWRRGHPRNAGEAWRSGRASRASGTRTTRRAGLSRRARWATRDEAAIDDHVLSIGRRGNRGGRMQQDAAAHLFDEPIGVVTQIRNKGKTGSGALRRVGSFGFRRHRHCGKSGDSSPSAPA